MKKLYFLIGFFSVFLGILSFLYSNGFIFSSHIEYYGFISSFPNFFFLVGFVFIFLSLMKKIKEKSVPILISISMLASIGFEFDQFLVLKQSFNVKDIIAIIVGSLFSLLLFKLTFRENSSLENIIVEKK